MKALVIREPGDPSVLCVLERDEPSIGSADVLVRVSHAALNRADLLQRVGVYPAPPGVPADIPGLEYAGTVERIGEAVTAHRVGDRVYGIVAGGAQAEFVGAHEREVVAIPNGISFEQAAAVPEAFITAYDALVVRARLTPGELVLIHAVGSGVGTAGLQVARALGCYVVGTSRTQDKLDQAALLGLSIGLCVPGPADLAAVAAQHDLPPIDVVLDLLGGAYLPATLPLLKTLGRVAAVGLTAGRSAELDLGVLLRKRLSITGTVLRSRPLEEKIAAAHILRRAITPWLAEGRIRPIVDRVFPLALAAKAHEVVASNTTYGKVLLEIGT